MRLRPELLAILILAIVGGAWAGGGDEVDEVDSRSGPSDVVILTSENFDDLTAQGSWLIEFFAPWCGHCKKLKPIWEDAASQLGGKLNLATVDCTAEKALQDRFEVKSFPTIKFWRGGVARPYKGDRTVDAFVKFGIDMGKPAVDEVTDAKSVKETQGTTPVGFLFVGQSADAVKTFGKVAYANQGSFKFMREKGDKLAKKYDVKSGSAVIALCEGGEEEKFLGPWTEEALTEFVEKNKLPLLSELDAINFEDVTTGGKIVIFSVTDPAASGTKAYLKTMLSVARRYRDFIFANIDGVKFSKYVAQFSITPEGLPSLFALNYPKDEYYLTDENARNRQSEAYITQFADGILSGSIPARATAAWYSPMRYYKMFEKWLGTFTEGQLAVGVVLAMVTFIAIIGAGCYYGTQDFAPDPNRPAGSAPTATTSGTGKKDQ